MNSEFKYADDAGDEWSLTIKTEEGLRPVGELGCSDPLWDGVTKITGRVMHRHRIISEEAFAWLREAWLRETDQELLVPPLLQIARIGRFSQPADHGTMKPQTTTVIVSQD